MVSNLPGKCAHYLPLYFAGIAYHGRALPSNKNPCSSSPEQDPPVIHVILVLLGK
jgi:hypothetical protein